MGYGKFLVTLSQCQQRIEESELLQERQLT